MKFVKALLVVTLLIISVLLLIGVFVPELDDTFETRIDRPLIQVYASMMNVQNAPEWVAGLDSVERTSGFLAMPGSSFKLYYTGMETNFVYNMEVVQVVPLQSLKFKLRGDLAEFEITIDFKADGMATVLNTYVQMRGTGMIERSFLPLLKSSIMQQGKDDLEAFKQLQEN